MFLIRHLFNTTLILFVLISSVKATENQRLLQKPEVLYQQGEYSAALQVTPDLSEFFKNIADDYYALGKYPMALEYHQKALAIREKGLGKQHPDTATSYNNIGATYDSMGDYANAYHYAKKAFTIFLQQRDSNFSALDSAQKKQYLTVNENWIDYLLDHSQHYQEILRNNKHPQQATDLAQTTLNDWLAYKGSIFDSENRLIRLAKSSKDPAIQQKYQQSVQLKKTYSKLNQNYPAPKQKDAWQQKLKQYEAQIAMLEREIIQADPRFKTEKALLAITSKDIADHLNEKELYIDYGKTNYGYYLFTIDNDNAISFSAFTKKDSKAIDQQLALFGGDIKAIIAKKENLKEIKKKSTASLSQLYQLLIPPALAAKIASKDSLIISPNGGLRLLPFEALYNADKKHYLIEQKDIRYIASSKELVRLFRQQEKDNKIGSNIKVVIFANPNFDEAPLPTPTINQTGILRTLGQTLLVPLPMTGIEAEAIISILKRNNVSNIHYYQQKNATEANLLNVKQPTILHIATYTVFDTGESNAMLQSGIALAGANDSMRNDTDEGIVTALDLSVLNLKGTQLVVLSACGYIGLGNPSNDTNGLATAFIQAGARSVIMSLWNVADKETVDLMQSFYQATVDNDYQYAKALRQSKLKMIKDGLHPYYWAAFVLSGL